MLLSVSNVKETANSSLGPPTRFGATRVLVSHQLGPPVERFEYGYPFFSVVYFSRGTLSQQKKRQKGT